MAKILNKLFILILLFITVLFAEAVSNSLTVTGEGIYSVRPEIINLVIAVEKDGVSASEAQEFHKKSVVKILDAIKINAVESNQVKTDNYTLYPVYIKTAKNEVINKYRASMRITVELYQVAGLGKLLDDILAAGIAEDTTQAARLEKVIYLPKDEQGNKNEAVKLAVRDAKTKAAVMAEEMNYQLGKVSSLVENITITNEGQSDSKGLQVTEAELNKNLPQNKTTYTGAVKITYEIQPKD